MQNAGQNIVLNSNRSFYDVAALWSLIFAIVAIPLDFSILSLLDTTFTRLGTYVIRILPIIIFLIPVSGFIFGFISLFGTRKRKISFWLALVGVCGNLLIVGITWLMITALLD